MTKEHPWWRILVATDDVDNASVTLIEAGCSGTEILSDSLLAAFIQCPKEALSAIHTLEGDSLRVSEIEPLSLENWHDTCQEVWEEIQLQHFKVIPISAAEEYSYSKQTIAIIPGMGFGTGHHETTSMLLQFIDDLAERRDEFSDVLDLGCGSAILAIAAERALEAECLAVDNDGAAISNAAENRGINESSIILVHGTLDCVSEKYDLLIANIYSSILLELSQAITARTKKRATLLLSGIQIDEADEVIRAYQELGWKLLRNETLGKWAALRFARQNG